MGRSYHCYRKRTCWHRRSGQVAGGRGARANVSNRKKPKKKKQALKVVNYGYRAKRISGNSTYLIGHGDWGLRCRKLVMLEIKEEAIFKREKKRNKKCPKKKKNNRKKQ